MTSVASQLKKSYEAVRTSQLVFNKAIVLEGAKKIDPVSLWPETPTDAFLKSQLPLENDQFRIPKETNDGLILDYDHARDQLPHFRKYFDAVQKWEKVHDDAIAALPVGITPKTLAVMQETIADLDGEEELLGQHLTTMRTLINARLEDLEFKRDNLLDVKIKDLVEEYPEWMDEMKKEATEFKFTHPEDENVPWYRE